MTYQLYCIRDLKVGFGSPQIELNEATAIRGFSMMINSEQGLMAFEPKDFDLYHIGTFDSETGMVTCDKLPTLISNGLDVHGK